MKELHRMQRIVRCTLSLVVLLALMAGGQKAAADTAFGEARFTVGGRVGDGVSEYLVDVLQPAWERDRKLFLLNARGTFLEDKEQEASAGMIGRLLTPSGNQIFGVNFYFDTRWTESNNRFHQVGGGVEWFSRWVDMRANVYYPVTNDKEAHRFEDVVTTVSGRRTTTETITYVQLEEALPGFDAEIGVWLPYLSRYVPTALFVGYYDFRSDLDRDISGVRARLESRLHPNLTLDAEWFENDRLNRTDYFVGLRAQMPLDFWNGLRFDRDTERSRLRRFESRMTDMVYRDFRIRTMVSQPEAIDRQSTTEVRAAPRAPAPSPDRQPLRLPPPPPPPPTPVCQDYLIGYGDDGTPIFTTICE